MAKTLLFLSLSVLVVLGAGLRDDGLPEPSAVGIPESTYPMVLCSSCTRAMAPLQRILSKYIVAERRWTKKLKREINDAVTGICGDVNAFPSDGDAMFLKGCTYLLADFRKQIMGGFRRRLVEKYDEYHEDFNPREFCGDIGACTGNTKSLDSIIGESEAKSKWEQAYQDRHAKKGSKKKKDGEL